MTTPASKVWPALPYEAWSATCDTLHAHTQVLGKVAVALAPPEWQLEHAALRLTARGFETAPLPAADGSGAFVVALNLHSHEAEIEHSRGRVERVPLTPNRPVADVTRDVLGAIGRLSGPIAINPQPQEVPWQTPLDQDFEHHTYEPSQVADYFAAATQAALVLAAVRAPFWGRSSPVDAWWGSFDLAIHLFNGLPAEPPSRDYIMRNSANAEQIGIGWWPGDARYPRAAFYAFAMPAPPGYSEGTLAPKPARWEAALGEYILDWDDVIAAPDPFAEALAFGRSAVTHACSKCGWEQLLTDSVQGAVRPVS